MCKMFFGHWKGFNENKPLFVGSFEECCARIHQLDLENSADCEEAVFIIDEKDQYWYPVFDKDWNPKGVEKGPAW
mgnify:CR=1 FL=1